MHAQDATRETGVKHCALFLRLIEELFRDGYLRCAAVEAEDKRALMLFRER
jgi:hypothetical protein